MNGQRLAARRHLPAILVDLVLIGGPTIVAIAALHERFVILTTTDGSPRFSPSDQARINEIDQGFNRGLRLGDDIYTLSGSGWWLTMLILSAATIAVFVAAPALMARRTPGQRLLGMLPFDEPTMATLIDPAVDIDLSESSSTTEIAQASDPQTETPDTTVDIRTEATIEATDPSERPSLAPRPEPDVDADVDVDVDAERDKPSAPPLTIDVSDRIPAMPITLADESEYDHWDREQARYASQPSDGSTMVDAATPHTRTTAPTRTETTSPPEWSAEWNAWMYWDAATKRWFKHDANTDRWNPIS